MRCKLSTPGTSFAVNLFEYFSGVILQINWCSKQKENQRTFCHLERVLNAIDCKSFCQGSHSLNNRKEITSFPFPFGLQMSWIFNWHLICCSLCLCRWVSDWRDGWELLNKSHVHVKLIKRIFWWHLLNKKWNEGEKLEFKFQSEEEDELSL